MTAQAVHSGWPTDNSNDRPQAVGKYFQKYVEGIGWNGQNEVETPGCELPGDMAGGNTKHSRLSVEACHKLETDTQGMEGGGTGAGENGVVFEFLSI